MKPIHYIMLAGFAGIAWYAWSQLKRTQDIPALSDDMRTADLMSRTA